VRGSAGPFLVSRLREAHPGPILIVAPTSKGAERFASDLQTRAA
jgi:hypothetical protein